MPVEVLTYAVFGSRLNISPVAARSLARRLGLPRTLSDDGKALVSVDLAGIRHTPRRARDHAVANIARVAALQAEIARLEARAADHRADFERERERGDRLSAELLQVTAEASAARAMTERLEGLIDSQGQAARKLGHLAAAIVEADRKACK